MGRGEKDSRGNPQSTATSGAASASALAEAIHAKVIELGKHVVRMTTKAGSGHPSSALSLGHIVVCLMYKHMRWDPADPWSPASDRLILSEGHSVPIVYAAYADLGGMVGKSRENARRLTVDDLEGLREIDSVLDGHPNPAEGVPFFDAATGSLGQGLSVAAGLALAARLRGLDRRFFCIIGDGEAREGQIWEAADFIADYGLNNVTAIFNCNGQGQADYVSNQQSADVLAAKLAAYGWSVEVINGHDPEAILKALQAAAGRDAPTAIVARTEKGWGVEDLKDKGNHGKPLPEEKLQKAVSDLDGMYKNLQITDRTAQALQAPQAPAKSAPLPEGTIQIKPFEQAIADAGLADSLEKGKLATRRAYGAALLALGEADERIVALDGDVSNSTFALFFAKKFPERFFECKIAEQNMVSAAVGLAAAGYVPFVSSFSKFLVRAYDQIEMAHITRANIKLVGSHAGVSLGADGPSQMGLPDVAFFRSFSLVDNAFGQPACVSFHPADAVAAYHLTKLMANHRGMAFMRTHRPDVPLLYAPGETFEIGGSKVLVEGDALAIVAAGYMVHVARSAAEILAKDGIQCTLIDAYSFPLHGEPILAAAAKAGGRILTVEDNYGGGLWSAVAEIAAERGDIRVSGMVCRRIPKSGTPDDVLAFTGVSAQDIVEKVKALLG